MYDNRVRICPVRRKHLLQVVGWKSNIQREFQGIVDRFEGRLNKKGQQKQIGTKCKYSNLEV